MTLGVSNKFVCIQFLDWGFIDVAGRDFASINEAAEPLGGVWVDFVVEIHRPHPCIAGSRVTRCPRTSTGFTRSIASGPMMTWTFGTGTRRMVGLATRGAGPFTGFTATGFTAASRSGFSGRSTPNRN
jgi:hypothetical protein